ncbi:uncharacterized protein LOC134652988 [Cydia amplana]|uniref:uncharacterized protein LOC134652988 n=1 Tax=Cydia amplana TaxID=1869771 RepID=UPI002FE568B2
MWKSLFFVLASSWLVSCVPPPHPAVIQARREEEFLPQHLRSRALYNPHLREVLPLSSLLHSGEQLVYERESDKVPRTKIYNLLTHSGLVPRQFHQHPQFQFHQFRPAPQFHAPQFHSPPVFHDPPFLPNPDVLQRL